MSDGGTTVEDLLAEISTRESVARVLLRQDLDAKYRELERELATALQVDDRENRDPEAPKIARQLEELSADIDAATREFRFRAVGRRKWSDLLAKYPPTKDQLKADQSLTFDPARLPAAAIAECSVEPKITIEEAKQLEDRLNDSQFNKLWAAVVDANVGGGDAPKSPIAGLILRRSEQFARIAENEESPDPSSLAE